MCSARCAHVYAKHLRHLRELAPPQGGRYELAQSIRPYPRTGASVIPRARTTRRLQVLTRREARIVRALAETTFPTEGIAMPNVDEAQVVEYFDELLGLLELKERVLIRSLLVLLELQTLAFNGLRPQLFTRASLEDRTKNLLGWERSRFFHRRIVFMAIRTLLIWAYVDSREAGRDMGFVPGTHITARRNRARQVAAEALVEVHASSSPLPIENRAS